MSRQKIKSLQRILVLVMLISLYLQCSMINVSAAGRTPSVKYSLHVQDKGWMSEVRDGATAGTTGKSLQAEAVKIQISGMSGGITYRTHVQDIGWSAWSSNNSQSGTVGRNLQMEAVQIKLTGEIASYYDVYYRVHLAYIGWLGWTKNGGMAGSEGCGIQMEAIQIKLSAKTNPLKTSQSSISKPALKVKAHVQNIGWQNAVGENQTAGTTGRGYQLEALQIQCPNFLGGNGINYRAHIEDAGWLSWQNSGGTAGTVGKAKRIEAVQIKLTGVLADTFNVYYRAHCADYGWLGWACNGESAGTTGGAKQMEAIQIKLVPKSDSINKGGAAYHDLTGTANNVGNSDNNASYSSRTVRITQSPQIVDTFNGVNALYLPGTGNTNTGTYCCAEFVSKYYRSVYGVNVWNMYTNRTPSPSKGSFVSTTSPQAGDIGYQLNSGGSGHWFIIKAVNGSKCTVIEQNWKWSNAGNTYCTVNRVVTQGSTRGLKFYHWNR